jgi:predicted RNase H-like HicB family nuclease
MTHSEAHKYELVIYWSAEDRLFLVEVPDLPGCMADGETPAEAAANAAEVISVWIEAARAAGREVPEPRRRAIV